MLLYIVWNSIHSLIEVDKFCVNTTFVFRLSDLSLSFHIKRSGDFPEDKRKIRSRAKKNNSWQSSRYGNDSKTTLCITI